MEALKIQVKIFAAADVTVDEYVPVFHRWIRENVLDELMIDVVDYTHVTDGPAVVLLGHESDYAIDRGDGRLGLLYVNKRGVREPGARVEDALRRALNVSWLLEQERSVPQPLRFRTDELSIRIADRLNAPNTDETYARLLPELRAGVERVYGAGGFDLARVGGSRELFTVSVRGKAAPALSELGQRIAS